MAYEFKLPDLGEGLTEGEIARWLVTEGQELAEDDPLVEIQTDKTTVEIPSPAAGTVSKILVAEGEVVPVGTVLVVIGGDAGAPDETEPVRPPPGSESVPVTQSPSEAGRVQATPIVRRIAQELGVDLASLSGTGRTAGSPKTTSAAPARSFSGRTQALRGPARAGARGAAPDRRALDDGAPRVPAVTFVEECDFTGLDLARLLPLTLQATAASLQEFPELNARLEGDEIVYLERYDIGVAVQTDQGLVVPVVRGCDTTSLEELTAEVGRLADAARPGR